MSTGKFGNFDKTDFDFKSIHGHALKASILVPKSLQFRPRGKYPVIVNWHGGGFVVGDRLYEAWLPTWLLDVCLTNTAIFIAPDYRLLPEASALEILDDVEDFWLWLHGELPFLTQRWNAVPDLDRIACTGQSAGGYLAVQSALLFPDISRIKVIGSMGGSLNTDVPYCRIPRPKVILGKRPPPPGRAESVVRQYVKNIKPNAVRTSGDVLEMWDFLTCVLQQAYLARWLGINGEHRLDAMKALETAKDMPPMWIVHGEQDSVVPPACSTGFVEKLKDVLPNVPVLMSLQPGDHGFEALRDGEEGWVQQGMAFINQHWY